MLRILSISALILLSISTISAQADLEKQIQTRFILAEDGAVIDLPAGKIELTNTLSLDGKKRITIRGAGRDKTVLTWKNQKQGAEGLRISNAQDIVVEQFTMEDSKGDLLKALQVKGLTLRNLTAQWTGKPKASNGSYALYPVQCTNVHIETCTAIGASDAGIYVGQSDSVWVTDCTAKNNVAGIEIENTTNAWVSNNKAFDNTGGILVFDLPGLLKKSGGHVKVWKNLIARNDFRNFAPKGNIVAQVLPGTGVMVLATRDVEVYENKIWENKTASVAVVSYLMTGIPISDKSYNPYPALIDIHDNVFSIGKRMPTWKRKLGFKLWLTFGRKVPHILYDGIRNPDYLDNNGKLKYAYRICIRNNEDGTFANLMAGKNFKGITTDLKPYDCSCQ
jgi:parallel beta-helix repeat protein